MGEDDTKTKEELEEQRRLEEERRLKEEQDKKNVLVAKAWYSFPLYIENRLRMGKYLEKISQLPFQNPPFEKSQVI